MKWWHVVLGLVAIWIISAFVVPPRISCKFAIWNPNACANTETASKLLTQLGYPNDPGQVPITQGSFYRATGDAIDAFQK